MVVQLHSAAEHLTAYCERYPEGTFVLPHIADSPKDVDGRVRILKKYPNLCLDLCGNGYERMGILEIAVGIDCRRVLFGSDYTINDPASVIARVTHAYLTDEEKGLILGGNTRRLLEERGCVLD